MSSPPQTPDLFDAPLAQSVYNLDTAYTAHDERTAKAAANPWRWWWLLFVLIAVNLGLWFAYTSTGRVFGLSAEQAPQADLAESKIMPIKVKRGILPAPALPAATPAAAVTALPAEKTVCVVWEFYSNADVKRADNRLVEEAWSGYVKELANELSTYMVFVGPFNDRTEMSAKIKVLEKMKLKDYSPLPNGLISLGVLSTAEAAKALKQSLTKRGLLGVEMSERSGSGKRTRYRFEGLSPNSLKELNALSTELGLLRACP